MSYRADKLGDGRTDWRTDAGNDNTRRPILASGKKWIQPINRLKTVSKVGDLSSTIAMTVHCFGALSQVHAIGHCATGQERDLL